MELELDQIDDDFLDKHRTFNSACIRKTSNFSKTSKLNVIDSKNAEENAMNFAEEIQGVSPKINGLFETIDRLDKEDHEKHGKVFKHFIFTDIRSSLYGAKIIGSAFIHNGYTLGYTATKHKDKKTGDDKFSKISLLSQAELEKTKNRNFYILNSGGVFNQPIGRELKKNILKNFNERPDNVHGKNVRFIIMDSGYKEGIDLFDIKYIHIFEPQSTMADLKQVIGRGTRLCGQKGLEFHPTLGWELNVYIYDLHIDSKYRPMFLESKTAFELYLKSLNQDLSLYNFQAALEETAIRGAVDYRLNKKINFAGPYVEDATVGGGEGDEAEAEERTSVIVESDKKMDHAQMKKYIKHFSRFKWDKIKVENLCVDKPEAVAAASEQTGPAGMVEGDVGGPASVKGGAASSPVLIEYTKTQDFVRHFFTPQIYNRGILLWHSVGTGKTCTAIATATSTFEKQGYTILWVTRTTLVNDIWKNMFSLVCNETIRDRIKNENLQIPEDLNQQTKLLSKSWRIHPLSYKQFTNLVSKKNRFYKALEKLNGAEDPLHKTLIIIDEAHKLYGASDLLANEKPNMEQLHMSLMNSYAVSGKDSAKLILMTATPITQNPMELVRLINLCKPLHEQLPSDFQSFKEKFLTEEGAFRKEAKAKFMDEIAGYISYLDRSNDMRQFAQPKIHAVNYELLTDEEFQNDKREQRELKQLKKVGEVQKKEELKQKYTHKLQQLKKIKKEFKKDLEEEFGPKLEIFKTKKLRNKAEKTVKNHIKSEYADVVDKLKEKLKKYKEKLDAQKKHKKPKKKAEENPEEQEGGGDDDEAEDEEEGNAENDDIKRGVYYGLKYKCGKSKTGAKFEEFIKADPKIMEIDEKIAMFETKVKERIIRDKEGQLIHKNSIKKYSKINPKTGKISLNIDIHKRAIAKLKEERKADIKMLNREIEQKTALKKEIIGDIKKTIKHKIKQNLTAKRKELKRANKEKMQIAVVEYDEKTANLLQAKREKLNAEIERDFAQLLDEESSKTQDKEAKREQKAQEKEAKREHKVREKEAEKTRKVREKEAEKTRKVREKEEEKTRKVREKEAEKERKAHEKEAEKTRKIREKEEEKERKAREREANKTRKVRAK